MYIYMPKTKLHPETFLTKIYCGEKVILETHSTQKKIQVDVWSGNHPAFTNCVKYLDLEGRIARYKNKYKSIL